MDLTLLSLRIKRFEFEYSVSVSLSLSVSLINMSALVFLTVIQFQMSECMKLFMIIMPKGITLL